MAFQGSCFSKDCRETTIRSSAFKMARFSLDRSTANTVSSKQSPTSKSLFALLVFTKKIGFKVYGVSTITTEVAKTRKDAKSGFS